MPEIDVTPELTKAIANYAGITPDAVRLSQLEDFLGDLAQWVHRLRDMDVANVEPAFIRPLAES